MTRLYFVYGTLMSSDLTDHVIGRRPVMIDAELSDYFRHKLQDVHYPAVSQRLNSSVRGKLISVEADEEVALLDQYEGSSYKTVVTEVLNLESGEKVSASVYVWGEDAKWLLDEEWVYDNDFRNPFIVQE